MKIAISQLIFILCLAALAAGFFGCAAKHRSKGRLANRRLLNWVCVYSRDASPTEIAKFDLAVLDSDAHPELRNLSRTGTILIGYVSLGEAAEYRTYWPNVVGKSWLLDKNPNWDSYFVDVRAEEWHRVLTEKIIPGILQKGFDGLFLDTIDTAKYLEKYHPDGKYPGAQAAMVKLIKRIRQKFPKVFILGNRGFSILDETGRWLDGVVAESVFSTLDFERDTVRVRSEQEYAKEIALLQRAKNKFGLEVFTLDYLPPANDNQIQAVIARSRSLGFLPYISTKELDRIYSYTLE